MIAAPNLFGDVLADLGAVLLGSRGMSFSGNFSESGAAVYQTNHGSALDLAGSGRANPIGQISSLAMMLRESFGLAREAALDRGVGRGGPAPRLPHLRRGGARDDDRRHRRAGRAHRGGRRTRWRAGRNEAGPPPRRPPARLPERPGPRAGGPRRDRAARARLLAGARAARVPVVHAVTSVDAGRRTTACRTGRRRRVCAASAARPGTRRPRVSRPRAGETVVSKAFFSAFSAPGLDPALAAAGRTRSSSPACTSTAACARRCSTRTQRGLDVWIAEDAVGSDDPLHAAVTRRYLDGRAARFATVEELLCRIRGGARRTDEAARPAAAMPHAPPPRRGTRASPGARLSAERRGEILSRSGRAPGVRAPLRSRARWPPTSASP